MYRMDLLYLVVDCIGCMGVVGMVVGRVVGVGNRRILGYWFDTSFTSLDCYLCYRCYSSYY